MILYKSSLLQILFQCSIFHTNSKYLNALYTIIAIFAINVNINHDPIQKLTTPNSDTDYWEIRLHASNCSSSNQDGHK